MEAARRPRWRLSRRRPRSGDGPPSGCPWFLLAGSESQPWALLLRIASSEQVGEGELLPPLPTFPSQEPGTDPGHTLPPETFTVGTKTFSWTPFPPALGCFYQDECHQEFPTGSLKGHPEPDPCGTPSTTEPLPMEGPPALQSCPMCQKLFSPRLAQLDVDSHLAQCLAESTEDVAW